MKVTYKQDNCLYIRVQIYPSWFAIAPPVAVDAVTNVATLGHGTNLNYNDQREFSDNKSQQLASLTPLITISEGVGCPHDPYQGPELANPWNLLGFRRPGHDTPGGTPNHKSGNDFLDKLRGNTEDFTPLYPSETATPTPGATPTPTPGDKKSEVDTPSTVAYNDGTTDTTDASTNLLPQSFGSINLDTDFSSNAGATSQTGKTETDANLSVQLTDTNTLGSILSFNTGITGDNNAATTNPAIAQPYDTAFVDSSLSGNNENTPQDPSYQAGGDNPFPDYGLNFGFGVKARRSPRDFRLLA